jgi:phage shock protein A
MSILKRAIEITEAKVNKLLNRLEDPNATLDLSYEKMLSGLQEVKAHLVDVVTEQQRLQNRVDKTKKGLAERDEEAKAALKLGKEDLARQALSLKHTDAQSLTDLEESLERITGQVNKLKETEVKYRQRIQQFKHQKEVTKATYQAAKAQVKVNESLSGIGNEINGVGSAIQRAQDKNEQMQARAQAMDNLVDTGVLNDPFETQDSVKRDLNEAKKQASVEDDLAALKAELTEK